MATKSQDDGKSYHCLHYMLLFVSAQSFACREGVGRKLDSTLVISADSSYVLTDIFSPQDPLLTPQSFNLEPRKLAVNKILPSSQAPINGRGIILTVNSKPSEGFPIQREAIGSTKRSTGNKDEVDHAEE